VQASRAAPVPPRLRLQIRRSLRRGPSTPCQYSSANGCAPVLESALKRCACATRRARDTGCHTCRGIPSQGKANDCCWKQSDRRGMLASACDRIAIMGEYSRVHKVRQPVQAMLRIQVRRQELGTCRHDVLPQPARQRQRQRRANQRNPMPPVGPSQQPVLSND
jgi:hypothetical protein